MFPNAECLDHTARKPYYLSGPNDVWSLGVILVNLTCGRNPWKQASAEDSTYRAFAGNPEFLKTILPLTDELNHILRRIFERNPDHRITLSELRSRIVACPRLTVPAVHVPLGTPPISPEPTLEYVYEDAVIDGIEYDAPLSPASTGSINSDLASMASSPQSVGSLEDDFMHEQQQQQQIEIVQQSYPHTFEPEESPMPLFPNQEFVAHTYTGPVPVPAQAPIQEQMQVRLPEQAPTKSHFTFWWEMVKYAQQVPALQPHVPFHHQVPLFAALQGY